MPLKVLNNQDSEILGIYGTSYRYFHMENDYLATNCRKLLATVATCIKNNLQSCYLIWFTDVKRGTLELRL